MSDTIRCAVCGYAGSATGTEMVLLDGAQIGFRDGCRGAFCPTCAAAIHDGYRESLRRAGVCEHGVADGDYCKPCNLEYKRAAERFDKGAQ